ncbi:hypothetical protein [Tropicibacter oceani]|uniref:DUF2497 domain-containing protein n=1 Tax=Tropicibacter oceani TaxID=3058420 RepID=A0ABY8QIC8_9RHOB|nr:hypothetical protein [Tropicibacter oceani]WGW03723.1 hypothetical protein QF118_17665 [Tropicibacter oceani]
MSDPVTNMEIEDVLSSIRRLVSEDSRPKRVPDSPSQPGKLVLTPALRVKQDSPAKAPDRPASAPVLLTNPTVLPAEDIPAEPAPEPQAAVELPAPEPAVPEQAEPQAIPETIPDADSAQVADQPEDRQDPAEPLPEVDETDMAFFDNHDLDDDAPLTASSILSQLVEQEVARAFSTETDDSAPAEQAADSAPQPAEAATDAPETAAPVEAQQPMLDEPEDSADLAPQVQSDTAAEDAPAQSLESKIAELEAMVGRTPDEWECDSSEEPAFVHRPATPIDWEDHHDNRPKADRTKPELKPMEPELTAIATENEALPTIDEATLREMVSDIVRQELQGALGERITRNVRKLVRREIHRAMVSQDFD